MATRPGRPVSPVDPGCTETSSSSSVQDTDLPAMCIRYSWLQVFGRVARAAVPTYLKPCLQQRCSTAMELIGRKASALPDRAAPTCWCNGASGRLGYDSLADFPCDMEPDMDELLIRAGITTWNAGPLRKGYGLCHGTAGNGYAFLKLHRRTGDQIRLGHARAFAMHAIVQQERTARVRSWTFLALDG